MKIKMPGNHFNHQIFFSIHSFTFLFCLLAAFSASLSLLASSVPGDRWKGVKFLSPSSFYEIDPLHCQLKNKNMRDITSLYERGEEVLLKLHKRPELAFLPLSSKSLELKFQGKLKKLREKLSLFIKDKLVHKNGIRDDALGVFYLELQAERFEISVDKIKDKIQLYERLLNVLGKEEKVRDALEKALKVLKGTKEVYQGVAHCHRVDSSNRKKTVAVSKDFGFVLNGKILERRDRKNIFEYSWETFHKMEERKFNIKENGERKRALF